MSPAWTLRKTVLQLTGMGDFGSETGLAERRVKSRHAHVTAIGCPNGHTEATGQNLKERLKM